MAELATIARPYAEALFQASAGNLDATAGWIDQLAAVVGNPQLMQFAANPKVAPEQVVGLVASLLSQPLPDLGTNFLRTVLDNGRLAAVPEVAVQFRALKNASSGSSDAVIYSAFPIEGAALQDIEATLVRRFGRKLKTSVAIDPELIGGIRAVVGDEVLDMSVKARLEQMKAALTA